MQIFRSNNKEHRHDLDFEKNEDVTNSNMPQFLPLTVWNKVQVASTNQRLTNQNL